MLQKPSGLSDLVSGELTGKANFLLLTRSQKDIGRERFINYKYQESNVKYICVSFMSKIYLTKAYSVLSLCLNYFTGNTHR